MAKAIRFEKGTLIGGRFEIDELIGDGEHGVVYRARDKEHDQACAVKLIRAELIEGGAKAFGELASRMREVGEHDHITTVRAASVDGDSGLPFVATDLVEGVDLSTWGKDEGSTRKDDLARLLDELGAALDHAHDHGLPHLALSPADVMVVKGDGGASRIEVRGFGIAGAMKKAVIGAPHFRAPEQIGQSMRAMAQEKGFTIAAHTGALADVFALGVLAFEAIAGTEASEYWGASDVADLTMKITLEPRKDATDQAGLNAMYLPHGFDDWFKRCTAHDARQRFPRASEATALLTGLLRGKPVDSKDLELPEVVAAVPGDASKGDTVVVQSDPAGASPTGPTEVNPNAPGNTVVGTLDAPPADQAAPGNTVVGGPAATLKGEPPQGLVFAAPPPAPKGNTLVGPLTGPPNAPPVMPPAPKKSNTGLYLALGGLVALLLLLGGGGFLTYTMLSSRDESMV